jgi:hypothetical protein
MATEAVALFEQLPEDAVLTPALLVQLEVPATDALLAQASTTAATAALQQAFLPATAAAAASAQYFSQSALAREADFAPLPSHDADLAAAAADLLSHAPASTTWNPMTAKARTIVMTIVFFNAETSW